METAQAAVLQGLRRAHAGDGLEPQAVSGMRRQQADQPAPELNPVLAAQDCHCSQVARNAAFAASSVPVVPLVRSAARFDIAGNRPEPRHIRACRRVPLINAADGDATVEGDPAGAIKITRSQRKSHG